MAERAFHELEKQGGTPTDQQVLKFKKEITKIAEQRKKIFENIRLLDKK